MTQESKKLSNLGAACDRKNFVHLRIHCPVYKVVSNITLSATYAVSKVTRHEGFAIVLAT